MSTVKTFIEFKSKLSALQAAALEYTGENSIKTANDCVLDTIRYGNSSYRGDAFNLNCGGIQKSFITYLQQNYSILYNFFCLSQTHGFDPSGNLVDWSHFAVALQGVMVNRIHHTKEYLTWAGDLATAMKDVEDNGASASTVIGNPNYSFSKLDLHADLDAIVLGYIKGSQIKEGSTTFETAFNNYYKSGTSNTYDQRFKKFYSIYGGTSSSFKSNITAIADDVILDFVLAEGVSDNTRNNVIAAFIYYIKDNI